MKIQDVQGRWFWVKQHDAQCLGCKGNFGGPNYPRSGGSGLLAHINRCKSRCGRPVEISKWEEMAADWTDWDRLYRTTMIVKWMEILQNKIVSYGSCSVVCTAHCKKRVLSCLPIGSPAHHSSTSTPHASLDLHRILEFFIE